MIFPQEPNMKRAKIYGIKTFKGQVDPKESLISCVLKREWKLHESHPQLKVQRTKEKGSWSGICVRVDD